MNYFIADYLLPCAYKSLFGIECPVCGFQRSFLLLLQGKFIESIKMYAPLIPLLILIFIALLRKIQPEWIGKKRLSIYSLVVLTIIFINYIIELIL